MQRLQNLCSQIFGWKYPLQNSINWRSSSFQRIGKESKRHTKCLERSDRWKNGISLSSILPLLYIYFCRVQTQWWCATKAIHHRCILGNRHYSNPKAPNGRRKIYFKEIVGLNRPWLAFYYVVYNNLLLFQFCHYKLVISV